ncbi:hypothetical protein TWF694_005186 [Orbilia ellipsospora]|uniref:C2H2-type domain-containing protein n=1 Tax=Orbilia ellipsospora TaxID=2528407 RepID=A0AAV9WUT9_9PEZI
MCRDSKRHHPGILPPFPTEPNRCPPPEYHLYPFCLGDYTKYCPDPSECPIGAYWIKEVDFKRIICHRTQDGPCRRPRLPQMISYLTRGEREAQRRNEIEILENYGIDTSHEIAIYNLQDSYHIQRTRKLSSRISEFFSLLEPDPPPANQKKHDTATSTSESGISTSSETPTSTTTVSQKTPCPSPPRLPGQCKWSTCPLLFSSQEETLEHIKKDHIGSRKGAFYDFTCRIRDCPCGGKVFEKRDNIVSHVTNVGFDIRYAVCPFKRYGCTVALKREWDLPRHVRICKFNPKAAPTAKVWRELKNLI